MLELFRRRFDRFEFVVATTVADDGDMRPGTFGLGHRQLELTGCRWAMVAEDHGVGVFDADADVGPDADSDGTTDAYPAPGDVIVTCRHDRPVAVWAADCAPVMLCGRDGTVVGAHVGWRGLAAGVVDVAVDELASRGDPVCAAVLGPHIHAECYEFGSAEVDRVAKGVVVRPDTITTTTSGGQPALDVTRAVRAALARHGIELDAVGGCTSCDGRWFSHRARRDVARHAVVAWTTLSP